MHLQTLTHVIRKRSCRVGTLNHSDTFFYLPLNPSLSTHASLVGLQAFPKTETRELGHLAAGKAAQLHGIKVIVCTKPLALAFG